MLLEHIVQWAGVQDVFSPPGDGGTLHQRLRGHAGNEPALQALASTTQDLYVTLKPGLHPGYGAQNQGIEKDRLVTKPSFDLTETITESPAAQSLKAKLPLQATRELGTVKEAGPAIAQLLSLSV